MARVNKKAVYLEKWIIGIDEVGRGPLAGPVTVAAVAAPFTKHETWNMEQGFFVGIRDSKRLTFLQRERWNRKIRSKFLCVVTSVAPRVVDKNGINVAAQFAVFRCLEKLLKCSMLHVSCFMIFLDGGLHAPPEYKNQQTIIKGDERVPIIAAASIIAKVHRDRYMTRLAKKFPHYGFEQHKGYGTKAHMAAIKRYGLSKHHRVSFCKKIKRVRETDPLTS